VGIEPIAVVGLAARVPDARSADEFWANLLTARNSIHRLTELQLLDAGESPAVIAAPNYVRARPLLDDVWGFDNEYFGMSHRESELRNPQHRLFLELCATALQSAATVPERFDGAIGVYGGCPTDRFFEDHVRADPELLDQVGEMVALVSNTIDYLASYVSFRLGLRGPSLAVRTACSTSLVATHLACQGLRAGDCDLALAGGVEIETPYGRGYLHVEGGIDAEDGVCRPLDSAASGTVFGSGGGVVALKRLTDARANGDQVLAVILGSAVNNDGAERAGFTAPNRTGQSQVIAEAIAVSDVDSASISYVELHGTGTKVGDPVEILGLHEGMAMTARSELAPGSCAIGSVKSNLGHLGPASGVVGLIKTVLALYHETIPPTINVREVNPSLELEHRPFTVAGSVRPWPRVPGVPRRAGVSSFGFGGTNAHVVLEEAPASEPATGTGGPELLVWSGVDDQAREEVGNALLRTAAQATDADLPAIAHTSQTGRRVLRARAALRVDSPAAARAALTDSRAILRGDGQSRQPVFLFPGQGAQFPAMGLDAGRWLPDHTALIRRYLDDFGTLLETDLVRIWESERDPAVLSVTVHAQPLLFSVELACAQSLIELGVRPAAVLGHSVGELVAATVAGVFTAEDAIRVVAKRARLIQEMPSGAMLAVAAPVAEVRPALVDGVWVSAVNGPTQTVVGGTAESIAAFCPVLDGRRIKYRKLSTSHAFHTPMMGDAVAEFLAVVGKMSLAEPVLPLVSAASGRLLDAEEAVWPEFWVNQLVEPVLFTEALANLPVANPFLVEAGPGSSLSGLARRHPAVGVAGHPVVELLPKRAGHHVLDALGALWVNGADVDFGRLPREHRRKYPLPTYPYRRTEFLLPDRSHTVRPPAMTTGQPKLTTGQPELTRLSEPVSTPQPDGQPVIALPVWQPAGVLTPSRPVPPGARGHAVVLLPDHAVSAATARRVVQRAGYRVLPITYGDRLEVQDYGCVVRADHPEDLDAALDALAGGDQVELIVHAGVCGPVDGEEVAPDAPHVLERAVLSTLRVQQYAIRLRQRQKRRRALPVVVLTMGAVPVTAAEPLEPARAAAAAIVRSAVLEYGPGTARMLDVAGVSDHALAAEIGTPTFTDPVLAVRGTQVWRPGRVRCPLPEWSSSLLEPEGLYLITGGLGAVGLAVACGLADTGLQPKLVLLSRNADPQRLDMQTRRRLATLEAAGAEVTLVAGGVSDRAQMAALFERITAEHGPVHGILHAAGVAGGALIMNRERVDAQAVLRPKVTGAVVLRDLTLATPSIRFLALFSSRASLNGLVGNADYAAANAFMDALAASTVRDRKTTIVSIGWPTWHGVGMAAPAANPAITWRTRIQPQDWVVAEHRLDGVPLLPATGIIDLLVRAVRASTSAASETIRLADLTLTGPLTVERGTLVEVELVPDGDGWRATVRSQVDSTTPDEARAHVTARVSRPVLPRPDRLHLPDQAAGWARVDSLRPLESRFVFGPRFDVITECRRGADPDTTIGVLELPERFEEDLEVHALHPAMLDRVLALQSRPGDHIPFVYRRVVVHRDLPARVVARLSLRPDSDGRVTVDAVLCDSIGRLLVEVEGFTKIRLAEGKPVSAAPLVAPAPPENQPRIGLTTGITEDQGVATTLRLLCEQVQPHVAVVPAEEWTDDQLPVPPVAVAPPAPVVAVPPEPPPTAERPVDLVDAIRTVWAETLGLPDIAADSDFFAVGGDSLTAIQLMSRLQDRFGVELSVAELFDAPTASDLATTIGAKLG
jgi:phthiocerol/phenolphthiocerol synthesis type-I polyketide synthase E